MPQLSISITLSDRGVPEKAGDPVGHLIHASEQHLAFVGEVTEERSGCQPGTFGDLRDGGLLKAALGKQLQRGTFEALWRVRFPAWHRNSLT